MMKLTVWFHLFCQYLEEFTYIQMHPKFDKGVFRCVVNQAVKSNRAQMCLLLRRNEGEDKKFQFEK